MAGIPCRAHDRAPVEDPHGGAPAGEVARRYADSGPSTGSRRRPEVMIDRDVRDKERTAERFELRSAQEVASRFALLPGESGCVHYEADTSCNLERINPAL